MDVKRMDDEDKGSAMEARGLRPVGTGLYLQEHVRRLKRENSTPVPTSEQPKATLIRAGGKG